MSDSRARWAIWVMYRGDRREGNVRRDRRARWVMYRSSKEASRKD